MLIFYHLEMSNEYLLKETRLGEVCMFWHLSLYTKISFVSNQVQKVQPIHKKNPESSTKITTIYHYKSSSFL